MLITVKTRNQPDFQTELTNAYPQDIEFFESNQIQIEMHVGSGGVIYQALLADSGPYGEPLGTSVHAEEGVSMHETMSRLRAQCEELMG